MPIIAADLGGTKLALGLFSNEIDLLQKDKVLLEKREGREVGQLICEHISALIDSQKNLNDKIEAIGIAIPGIYSESRGTVWAPNIPGWENYPLMEELKSLAPDTPIIISSDRACYITAEVERGVAKNCTDAVFIAVGTGIGAGIVTGGKVLIGANDIAGAIGWMALERPFKEKYSSCGSFESTASGEGIVKLAIEKINSQGDYNGELKSIPHHILAADDIFKTYDHSDVIAMEVIQHCIEVWGMALANVVSMFNPQIVIFGGGVFGPARKLLPEIEAEARKWAQPVSMEYVTVTATALGSDAGLYGAACLAFQKIKSREVL